MVQADKYIVKMTLPARKAKDFWVVRKTDAIATLMWGKAMNVSRTLAFAKSIMCESFEKELAAAVEVGGRSGSSGPAGRATPDAATASSVSFSGHELSISEEALSAEMSKKTSFIWFGLCFYTA